MSDTRKPKRASKRHIADVQEPGTAAPSETSRPVIVSNRPLLKDPMVVEKKDSEEDENISQKPAGTLSSSGKPDLRPLDNSITPDEEAGGPDVQTPIAATTEEKFPGDEATLASQPERSPDATKPPPAAESGGEASSAQTPVTGEASDNPRPKSATSPETATTPPDGQPAGVEGTPKNAAAKKAEAEAAEQAKHDAALRKLVDSKQYVLPINTAEKRQTKRFVLLGAGLSVLLILVWLDIALDAGIFKLGGLNPVTHFFSN